MRSRWFCLFTFAALGAWLGVMVVNNLSETAYRWFIIAMTIIAAVFMVV